MNIPENFDRWMFDYMEGNLSFQEAEEFERFLLQNPDFEPDADAWNLATIPNEAVVYPNQHKLERKPRIIGWFSWSAAALVVLLVGTGTYLTYQSNQIASLNQMSRTTADDQFDANSEHFQTLMANKEDNEADNALMSTNHINQTGGTNYYGPSYSSTTAREGNSPENTLNSSVNESNEHEYGIYNVDAVSGNVSTSIKMAVDQVKHQTHHSKYTNNPILANGQMDLSKIKNFKVGSFSSKLKKGYRKIEKMVGYQTGIVNLRDPDLIMPENNVLASNPGFAGGMLKPRFEMNYRNQWLGSSMNGHQSKISFDNYIPELRSGMGLALNSAIYNNGAFADHSIDFSFSPKIVINKDVVFEPGVKVSLGVLSGNMNKLMGQSDVELDRGLAIGNDVTFASSAVDNKWYKDYGLGFVMNTTWFYAGFSADNLGGHYASVYRNEGAVEPIRTPVLYNAVIGYDWEKDNKKAAISPFVSYRQFGELKEGWGGLNVRLNNFTFGGSYSTEQNFSGMIGMKFKNFKLVYQYDETTTLLTNERLPSHNIGMRITVDTKNKKFN